MSEYVSQCDHVRHIACIVQAVLILHLDRYDWTAILIQIWNQPWQENIKPATHSAHVSFITRAHQELLAYVETACDVVVTGCCEQPPWQATEFMLSAHIWSFEYKIIINVIVTYRVFKQ